MTSPPTTTASPAEREVRPTSIAWRTDLPERPSSESRRRQSSLVSSVGSVSLPAGSVRADRQRLLSSPPPPPLVSPNSHPSLLFLLHQIPPTICSCPLSSPHPRNSYPTPPAFYALPPPSPDLLPYPSPLLFFFL